MSTAAVRTDRTQSFLAAPSFGHSRALLLDYDGTIAPFVTDRSRAYPYANIPELLDSIMTDCDTHVVIISGRAARDIPPLLGTKLQPEIWGCHGLERLRRNSEVVCAAIDTASNGRLAEAAMRLEDCGLKSALEMKTGCVAVHWRGLSTKEAEQVKALAYRSLGKFVGDTGLWLSEFDGGVELHCRACNKRRAVEAVLSEIASDAAVAYLGDDRTDEDAFRALNGRGLTILVRPTYRFTAAQFWLRPPEELKNFLHDWIQACRGEL